MARNSLTVTTLVLSLAAAPLAVGCGSGSGASAGAPATVPAAVPRLEAAMTSVGLATCNQKPVPRPEVGGALQAVTLTFGTCDEPAARPGNVEVLGFASARARAAGLTQLAQPALPWSQGWAWGRIAVVIDQRTPTEYALAVGKALDSLHATLVFEQ